MPLSQFSVDNHAPVNQRGLEPGTLMQNTSALRTVGPTCGQASSAFSSTADQIGGCRSQPSLGPKPKWLRTKVTRNAFPTKTHLFQR